MSNPILSICIATYNNKDYLKELIDEILKSTNQQIELVVSDNASVDGTSQMLDEYNDSRLVVLKNEENIGGYLNSINAFNAANGKYIMYMVDRDILYTDNLDKIVEYLSNVNVAAGKFFPSENNNLKVKLYKRLPKIITRYVIRSIHPSGIILNRDLYNKIKPFEILDKYDTKIQAFALDFVIMLLCQYGQFVKMNIKFVEFRKHPYEMSKHSATYSLDKGNLFFTPEFRFEIFKLIVIFLNVLKLNIIDRIYILRKLIKITYEYSTCTFLKFLDKKNVCYWYNVPQEYIDNVKKRNLKADFCDRIRSCEIFTTKLEYFCANLIARSLK